MTWALVVHGLLLALLAATGGGKLAGAVSSMKIRDSLDISPRGWRAIGVVEMLLVASLALGFFMPVVARAAYAGVGVLMVGAMIARARVGGPAQRSGLFADLVFLLCALGLLFFAFD